MDEKFEATTKPSHIMREVLVIPKPGLGMLALFLSGLVAGGVIFSRGRRQRAAGFSPGWRS